MKKTWFGLLCMALILVLGATAAISRCSRLAPALISPPFEFQDEKPVST